MQGCLHEAKTLQDFAQQAGLSVPHFCHLFKTTTGVSPMAYFHELKMKRACELLDHTNLSNKEIAL